jgi:hypothetical protein
VEVVAFAGTSTFVSSDGKTQTVTSTGTHNFPEDGWTDITAFRWNNTGSAIIDDLRVVVEEEDEPIIPDCGRSPYKPWPDQPGPHKYERQFWQPCENITGDPNETLFHNLYLPEAMQLGLQLGS